MRKVISALLVAISTCAATAAAQTPTRPIKANQTDGYGNERVLAFTYFMNFQCVHEPSDDLDNNGKPAAVDPAEFQSPRRIVGESPRIDPTGKPVSNTEPLYVIVPFFDADGDGEAASAGLAAALHGLFGVVPDSVRAAAGRPRRRAPGPGTSCIDAHR